MKNAITKPGTLLTIGIAIVILILVSSCGQRDHVRRWVKSTSNNQVYTVDLHKAQKVGDSLRIAINGKSMQNVIVIR